VERSDYRRTFGSVVLIDVCWRVASVFKRFTVGDAVTHTIIVLTGKSNTDISQQMTLTDRFDPFLSDWTFKHDWHYLTQGRPNTQCPCYQTLYSIASQSCKVRIQCNFRWTKCQFYYYYYYYILSMKTHTQFHWRAHMLSFVSGYLRHCSLHKPNNTHTQRYNTLRCLTYYYTYM